MTVTALDPKTALIVIDLQKGLMGLPATHPIAGVVANAATLAAAFRERGLPVVLVKAPGVCLVPALSAGWTDLIPGLNQQPQDHLVTKHTPGAFTSTGLEAHLRSLGVTQIVITGIATGSGVEMTARQAYELGLNTAFALDAMTDIDAEAHAYSVSRIFPRLGETGTTADIIALLKAEA
jgi:nicotinamidase-related amidase